MSDDVIDAEAIDVVDVEATEIPAGEEPDDIVDAELVDDDLGGLDEPGTDLATLDDVDRPEDYVDVTVEDATLIDHLDPETGIVHEDKFSDPSRDLGMPHGAGLRGGASAGKGSGPKRKIRWGAGGGSGGGSGSGGGTHFSLLGGITNRIDAAIVKAGPVASPTVTGLNTSGRRPSAGRRR